MLKIGFITPLFKDGNKLDPCNYCPISVLPVLGKIIERVIHSQLYSFFTTRNFFTPTQMGFRKGFSTGTCLVSFLDEIFKGLDQGRPSGFLFLDLKKAFDTVNHENPPL